jgi:hypothetical protein
MCFPNKKQKANFTDDTEKRDTEKPTKDLNSSTTPPTQSPPTIPPITNESVNLDMSTPKVAIIIYSMYGHIAKRSLGCSSNIISRYSYFLVIQLQRQRKLASKVLVGQLIYISTILFLLQDTVFLIPWNQSGRNPFSRDPHQDAGSGETPLPHHYP